MYYLIFKCLVMICIPLCIIKTGSQYMQLNYLTNNILILNFKVDFPVKVVAKNLKSRYKNERYLGSQKYVHI